MTCYYNKTQSDSRKIFRVMKNIKYDREKDLKKKKKKKTFNAAIETRVKRNIGRSKG